MLLKILGAIDIIAGFVLLFSGAGFAVYGQLFLFFGVVLIGKSLLGFFQDFASWIDLVTGLVMLIAFLVNVPGFIEIIFGLVVLQKGVMSFL